MNLQTEDHNGTQVVCVDAARIDAAVAIQFKDLMREVTTPGNGRVVMDLSRVEFLDSSGLGAVVAAMNQLGPDRHLDLAGLTPTVAKVFRLTRMDRIFRIHPDLDAALASGPDAA